MFFAGYRQIGLRLIASLFLVVSMGAGVAALAASPADEVVIVEDTLFGDRYPGRVRVEDAVKNGSGLPAVPMVDLDTKEYEKRLWLSEKKKISHPDKSQDARVVARDSAVFICYYYHSTLMTTFSFNFGEDWSQPSIVQPHCFGAPASLLQTESLVCMSYGTDVPQQPVAEVLFRRAPFATLELGDSTLVAGSYESWEYAMKPRMALAKDTLFVAYNYLLDDDRYVRLRMSLDTGRTWSDRGTWLGPEIGIAAPLLITDSVMSLVYEPEMQVEVRFHRSLDRGESWEASDSISMSVPPSQNPAAATDGISKIQTVWYDFEALPPDATGGWVYYRRSLDAGETWEDVRCLSTVASSESVEIWTDTNYTYACWSDARTGSPNLSLYLRYSHDDGSTWSPEIQIVDETDPAWDPDVYAQGDLVYIVWHEQHPPDWVWEIQYIQGAWYIPGDVDLSEGIDIADLVYMVDWMFTGGPAPLAYDAAQMDGLAEVDIADLVYIVEYMFDNGPPPVGGAGL